MQPESVSSRDRASGERPGIGESLNRMIDGASDETKAAFLKELHDRGETPEEVADLCITLRSKALLSRVPDTTDIVGTGGDGKNTINVSTAAAIVASASGIKVAKHGNFGATSNRGSADFLKHIGYGFEMSQKGLERRLRETSFAFILAPKYNDNFAKFARARKMLLHKTVFNYLGPLTNPADPDRMILGVTDRRISDLYSGYLKLNGKRGAVVYSEDGMDEVSPYSRSNVVTINDGENEQFQIDPVKILGDRIGIERISSPDPAESFRMTLEGLKGNLPDVSSFIALNASLPLLINNRESSLEDAYADAFELIRSGQVYEHLQKIVEGSQ